MRIVLFANNWGGWQVARFLRDRGEEIVGLVVQPEVDQRFAAEICEAAEVPPHRIWRASELGDDRFLNAMRREKPQIGVSAWFGYVLKLELAQLFSHGCINLHAAYLPWNRGWHSNVWPILDGSPAGVTIHYIDEGVDTGDVIAQARVAVAEVDTGGSLHRKLTLALVSLFGETWPAIVEGTNGRARQDNATATLHRRRDLSPLDEIDRAKPYRARDLLNLLRARTYPPYPAAFYMEDGEPRYVRLALSQEGAEALCLQGAEIDLNAEAAAGWFLEVLSGPGVWPAWFTVDGNRIKVRAELVAPEAIDTNADPEWIVASRRALSTEVASRAGATE